MMLMDTDMIDQVAYQEGQSAFKKGEIHNPYNDVPGTKGDKLWASWNRGYNDARRKELQA
jgi:hypothetical protein